MYNLSIGSPHPLLVFWVKKLFMAQKVSQNFALVRCQCNWEEDTLFPSLGDLPAFTIEVQNYESQYFS